MPCSTHNDNIASLRAISTHSSDIASLRAICTSGALAFLWTLLYT